MIGVGTFLLNAATSFVEFLQSLPKIEQLTAPVLVAGNQGDSYGDLLTTLPTVGPINGATSVGAITYYANGAQIQLTDTAVDGVTLSFRASSNLGGFQTFTIGAVSIVASGFVLTLTPETSQVGVSWTGTAPTFTLTPATQAITVDWT